MRITLQLSVDKDMVARMENMETEKETGMKSVYKLVIVVAVAVAAGMGTMASAFAANCCASHGASAKQAHTPAEVSAGHAGHERSGAVAAQAEAKVKTTGAVTVTGRNYCVGCSVTTKDSAMAECEKNGHKMVVKVKEARDADGKEVPELKGRVLRYTDNENAKTLSDKVHYGKPVTLSGSLSDNRLTVNEIISDKEAHAAPERSDLKKTKAETSKPAAKQDVETSSHAGHKH